MYIFFAGTFWLEWILHFCVYTQMVAITASFCYTWSVHIVPRTPAPKHSSKSLLVSVLLYLESAFLNQAHATVRSNSNKVPFKDLICNGT